MIWELAPRSAREQHTAGVAKKARHGAAGGSFPTPGHRGTALVQGGANGAVATAAPTASQGTDLVPGIPDVRPAVGHGGQRATGVFHTFHAAPGGRATRSGWVCSTCLC